MGAMVTREVLASGVNWDQALVFHLTANHYPPVHADFFPPIREAIRLANESQWDATVGLPNGRVLSVASVIEQLHLGEFLEPIDWEPVDDLEVDPVTLCGEHTDDGEATVGVATHCERCGVRVWE